MKKLIHIASFAFIVIYISACSGNKNGNTNSAPVAAPSISVDKETQLLLDDLHKNGDYVNSRNFPSLIKASVVNESLGGKILVIDLRPPAIFSKGHILAAVNKRFEDLPVYFESGIKPFEFDKIILVSDDGQISSYATMLLRLMGYGNVYSMRWGMSSWNNKFAEEGWLKGIAGNFESKLDTVTHDKPVASTMPQLKTGKTTGQDIGQERFAALFKEGADSILITPEEVFSQPQKYFIINYERKDKYDAGHIPGAVRFKPGETLGFVNELGSIPSDKPVVVYCGTGHNSAFVTAYLRLFGYDAHTLKYGNNGFMHAKMLNDKKTLSWQAFGPTDINTFEVVK